MSTKEILKSFKPQSELNPKIWEKDGKAYTMKSEVRERLLEIANQFLPEELKLFVRMKGVDTPEKAPRAKCEKENILAQKASNYTKNSIENAQKNRQKITFSEIKWDKYGGRIVAKVMINESDLGQELVKKGLARVYNGEKKKSWCKNI